MSRWCWILVPCLGCVEPTAELPPAELLLVDPVASGFLLGVDSLDWWTYEQVGVELRQTFHRREPLSSAPEVIATFVNNSSTPRLLGRVGDALLISLSAAIECDRYGLLVPGATGPTPVSLPRTGIPDHEPCWISSLGWHEDRMLYVGDFAKETIYGDVVYGDEVVVFDVASGDWTLYDYGPTIASAAFDSGRLVVATGSGFRLHDREAYEDHRISVPVRGLTAMTGVDGAVIFAEQPFADVVGPLYRATAAETAPVTVFAELGVQVLDLFTDGADVWATTYEPVPHLVRIRPDGEQAWYPLVGGIVAHQPGVLLLFDGDTGELWRQPLPR